MTETIHFEGMSLSVSDVERSVAFYQQFSFEVQAQNETFVLLKLGERTRGNPGLLLQAQQERMFSWMR